MDDYSKLDSPYLQPQVPTSPNSAAPNTNEYIISQSPDEQPKNPTNWLKTGIMVVVALVVVGGGGSAFYMIKSTTDSLTKAAKTQKDTIDDIINEKTTPDNSFSLVTKVQAGYEDPFEPTAEEANPFTDTKNPFDEIGP